MITRRTTLLGCACAGLAAQQVARKGSADYVNPNIGAIERLLTTTTPYV